MSKNKKFKKFKIFKDIAEIVIAFIVGLATLIEAIAHFIQVLK